MEWKHLDPEDDALEVIRMFGADVVVRDWSVLLMLVGGSEMKEWTDGLGLDGAFILQ